MTERMHNPPPPRLNRVRRIGRVMFIAALSLLVAGITVWGMLFLYYSNLPSALLRTFLAVAFAAGTLAAFVMLKNRRRTLLAFFAAFALLLIWFFSISPSNDRDWQPDVAKLAYATINGNQVTIHNIRNCDYRSETDYTPRYYDKTFDLDKLESSDLVCVYWGSSAIAHVMTSFGFGGDDFVTISIETRKEKGETYSTLAGFFRHYELIYVVADERDVIRVRTNFRNPREQVHIYRARAPAENRRALFLDYIKTLNELAERPAWYNTLVDNCTTGVLRHEQSHPHRVRYNWKILLSGYTAEYAYDIGMLDTRIPFADLAKSSLVNAKAEVAGDAPNFSSRIREDIPKPQPMTWQEFMRD
jgi:hypothetical protein